MTITTRWQLRTYDVWGNAEDGYEVNDSYSHGEIELEAEIVTHNIDTPHEFTSAELSVNTILEAFGIAPGVEIDTDGDSVRYYVNVAEDGCPIGELYCVSHESLSPIIPA